MSQAALDSTLQVRTPSTLQQVPVPVEVRNASMQLVARGQTGEMIRLARGQYIVSLSLPFGAKENRVVDVDPDHPGDLSIDWELPRGAAPVPPADGGPTGFESRVRGLDLGTAGPRRPVPGWLARFLVFKDGRSEVADQPPLLEVDDVEREDDRMDVFMFAHARTPELPFLQLAGDGLTPIVLALPIAGGSGAHVCTLHVTTTAGGISAAASPRGDTRTQVVAGYLEGGDPRAAVDVLARAEDLLYGKVENPIGAAIGGYALLRTGNLERLHDWPVNLANMFGWLPDGAVIAGEQAYRQGDREGARTWFLQAAGRGLPLLTDGFSMLLSRLRELALERAAAPEPALAGVADAGAGPPDGSGEGGGKEPALARLRRWSGYMDFSSLFVRARTADLADPGKGQHPLSEFTSAGGWRRFHGVGIARDPRDFWTSPEG